jgi:hypothetical protein
MVIAILGGRCCGKSDLASAICEKIHATVYVGRAYLEFAKDETEAKARFLCMLEDAQLTDEYLIYLVTEPELVELLPPHCLRVLCKAPKKTVKARFAEKLAEPLTPAVSAMLDRQYTAFDGCGHEMILDPTGGDPALLAVEVLEEAALLLKTIRLK